jgi:hypothetical protein
VRKERKVGKGKYKRQKKGRRVERPTFNPPAAEIKEIL